MGKVKLHRRTVLRGMLAGSAVAVSLPLLDIFLDEHGDALADGGPIPRRFGVFYWGNGVLPDRWTPPIPEGAADGQDFFVGDEWELSDELSPLTDVKPHLSVISGTKIYTGNEIAHSSGAAGVLSGAALDIEGESNTFRSASIDQLVAAEIGGTTRFRSIELAVKGGTGGLSFNGPNSKNPPEPSPFKFFQRVFGDGFPSPDEMPVVDPRIALRRSVLDVVGDHTSRLRARLGVTDRMRLEQHFEGIRALEMQLAALADFEPGEACERPDEPTEDFPEIEGRPQLSAINAAHSAVLAMALACDQTRVFSIWFTDPVSNTLFPGHSAGHHRLTHDEPGLQPEVDDIVKQVMTELGVTIATLAAVDEAGGSMLDNMAMLCTTDVSFARQHLLENMPIMIAGGACGALSTNAYYHPSGFPNTSHVNMTLLKAMGVPAASYGVGPGEVTTSFSAIER